MYNDKNQMRLARKYHIAQLSAVNINELVRVAWLGRGESRSRRRYSPRKQAAEHETIIMEDMVTNCFLAVILKKIVHA